MKVNLQGPRLTLCLVTASAVKVVYLGLAFRSTSGSKLMGGNWIGRYLICSNLGLTKCSCALFYLDTWDAIRDKGRKSEVLCVKRRTTSCRMGLKVMSSESRVNTPQITVATENSDLICDVKCVVLTIAMFEIWELRQRNAAAHRRSLSLSLTNEIHDD